MRGRMPDAGPPAGALRLPLRDIRFDADADLLTMALGGVAKRAPELRFYIEHPRRICATESAEAQSLLVTERSGVDIRVVVPRRVRGEARHERSARGRVGGPRSPGP